MASANKGVIRQSKGTMTKTFVRIVLAKMATGPIICTSDDDPSGNFAGLNEKESRVFEKLVLIGPEAEKRWPGFNFGINHPAYFIFADKSGVTIRAFLPKAPEPLQTTDSMWPKKTPSAFPCTKPMAISPQSRPRGRQY